MTDLLVVTDLDGSLLDHYTYSYKAAEPMLERLRVIGVPVVLCSSKTRAEMQILRKRLKLDSPYIVENGAAVYLPKSECRDAPPEARDAGEDWCKAFGDRREYWQELLRSLPDELRAAYRKFSKMSVGQIADLTGLPYDDAKRASLREFGEPLQWRGSDDLREQLIAALEAKGATVLAGGRFLHVGGDWDKGQALNWVADQRAAVSGTRPITVALGDSQNDVAMLEAADYAIVIRSPVHQPPKLLRNNGVIVTDNTGPVGWSEGLNKLLNTLTF